MNSFMNIALKWNMDHFDSNSVQKFSVGKAIGFKGERLYGSTSRPSFGSLCCNRAKIKLPFFPDAPDNLMDLLTSMDSHSIYFQRHLTAE